MVWCALPRRTENPVTKGLPAEQFSFPENVCTVIQTLASTLISCLTELAPAVNFTVNSTCCSRKLFNHNIKKLNRNPIHTVNSSCLSCNAWGMILPSDGHPNANEISFAAIHFKLLLNHSEVNSIWEEFASGLAQRDNGPIYYDLSNNSLSLAVQKYSELYAGLMRIKAWYIVIKLVI